MNRDKQSGLANVEDFSSLLLEADRAFRTDVAYAVSVCSAAHSIQSKREVWKYRLELRAAARKAQQQCRKSESFSCGNVAPCGLGDCKFAEGDLKLLNLESPGHTVRPQEDSEGSYSLEGAVEPLRALRSSTTGGD